MLCSDINEKALNSTVASINKTVVQGGGSAAGVVADVSKEVNFDNFSHKNPLFGKPILSLPSFIRKEDSKMLVQKCTELFGQLDIFFANAGILPQVMTEAY